MKDNEWRGELSHWSKKDLWKMLNLGLLYGPAIPFLETHPREIKTLVYTDICT